MNWATSLWKKTSSSTMRRNSRRNFHSQRSQKWVIFYESQHLGVYDRNFYYIIYCHIRLILYESYISVKNRQFNITTNLIQSLQYCKLITIIGRDYIMTRDINWKLIQVRQLVEHPAGTSNLGKFLFYNLFLMGQFINLLFVEWLLSLHKG